MRRDLSKHLFQNLLGMACYHIGNLIEDNLKVISTDIYPGSNFRNGLSFLASDKFPT